MSVKLLFNIVLKILGLLFLKEFVIAIPGLVIGLSDFVQEDISGALLTLLITIVFSGLYGLLIYLFIFKTDYVIEKLKLADSLFPSEIPLNIHRSTVISISLMIVALLLITQAIPIIIREIYQWYQHRQTIRALGSLGEPFDFSMLLVSVAELVIGLLIIGYLRPIVNFIELKQRQAPR